MALDKDTLKDLYQQSLSDHQTRIQNGTDAATSADQFFEDLAKNVVNHFSSEAIIEGGIEVEDTSGNLIGYTRKSNKGKLS